MPGPPSGLWWTPCAPVAAVHTTDPSHRRPSDHGPLTRSTRHRGRCDPDRAGKAQRHGTARHGTAQHGVARRARRRRPSGPTCACCAGGSPHGADPYGDGPGVELGPDGLAPLVRHRAPPVGGLLHDVQAVSAGQAGAVRTARLGQGRGGVADLDPQPRGERSRTSSSGPSVWRTAFAASSATSRTTSPASGHAQSVSAARANSLARATGLCCPAKGIRRR